MLEESDQGLKHHGGREERADQRAAGDWGLSRGWVDGAHFPGLGAKKTDCNLFPKLVLCWVGRRKNGTSVSLLFTPTLLGIQWLDLAEYLYKMKGDTN